MHFGRRLFLLFSEMHGEIRNFGILMCDHQNHDAYYNMGGEHGVQIPVRCSSYFIFGSTEFIVVFLFEDQGIEFCSSMGSECRIHFHRVTFLLHNNRVGSHLTVYLNSAMFSSEHCWQCSTNIRLGDGEWSFFAFSRDSLGCTADNLNRLWQALQTRFIYN